MEMKWYKSTKRPEHGREVLIEFNLHKSGYDNLICWAAGEYWDEKKEAKLNDDYDKDEEYKIYLTIIDEEDVELDDFKNRVKRWAYLD